MIVQYFSDLHLETYHKFKLDSILKKIKISGEVLILCGDIGNPFSYNYEKFIEYIHDKYKKIFIIAGNHEFYRNGFSIEDAVEKIKEIIKDKPTISFLNNSCEFYNNYLFVGTTLWSEITDKELALKCKINDLNSIQNMTIEKYNKMHQESVEFLKNIFKENENKDIIILTHHVPLFELIDDYYKKEFSNYNQWFATDLKQLLNKNIKYWFYGHTHTVNNSTLYDIKFCCNPIGYYKENNNIEYNKIIKF